MIKAIRISLTEKCNYNCFFCHNEGNAKQLEMNNISLERIRRLVAAGKSIGINKVTVTGGEPFLNSDLPKIIDIMREENDAIEINVASNLAIAKDESLRSIAKKVKRFNVNFQSIQEKGFRAVTGSGALETVKKKILLLLDEKAHVSLNFVFTKRNYLELPLVLEFANQNNVDVKILEMVKKPETMQDYVDIQIARSMVLAHRSDVREIKFKNSSDEIFYYDNQKVRIIYSYDNKHDIKAHREHGEVRITPTFEIRPCLNSDVYNFSLLKELDEGNLESISNKMILAYKLYLEQKSKLASVSIIKKENALIMVEREHHGKRTLETPGGHIEMNESPEEAVIREVKEESNLDVRIVKKLNTFYTNGTISHYFECKILDPAQLDQNPLIKIIPMENLTDHNITSFAKENLISLGIM